MASVMQNQSGYAGQPLRCSLSGYGTWKFCNMTTCTLRDSTVVTKTPTKSFGQEMTWAGIAVCRSLTLKVRFA